MVVCVEIANSSSSSSSTRGGGISDSIGSSDGNAVKLVSMKVILFSSVAYCNQRCWLRFL